jgi:hypothetical protein
MTRDYKVFERKLQLGLYWERQAISTLINYFDGKYSLLNTNDDYKYDFQLTNGLKYEVKYDHMASKTNNIFIEFEQYNKPSGILKTYADYYIIIVPYDQIKFLMVRVDDIIEFIKNSRYKKIYGDEFKKGFLFDVTSFRNISEFF